MPCRRSTGDSACIPTDSTTALPPIALVPILAAHGFGSHVFNRRSVRKISTCKGHSPSNVLIPFMAMDQGDYFELHCEIADGGPYNEIGEIFARPLEWGSGDQLESHDVQLKTSMKSEFFIDMRAQKINCSVESLNNAGASFAVFAGVSTGSMTVVSSEVVTKIHPERKIFGLQSWLLCQPDD